MVVQVEPRLLSQRAIIGLLRNNASHDFHALCTGQLMDRGPVSVNREAATGFSLTLISAIVNYGRLYSNETTAAM